MPNNKKLCICKIKSIVVKGNQLGRTVGMPTANFNIDNLNNNNLPNDGVYRSMVTLPDGTKKTGVTNVGTKPSVDKSNKKNIETHILDFEGDLYGQTITIELVSFIRNIKKFDSLEDVKKQVEKDIKSISYL